MTSSSKSDILKTSAPNRSHAVLVTALLIAVLTLTGCTADSGSGATDSAASTTAAGSTGGELPGGEGSDTVPGSSESGGGGHGASARAVPALAPPAAVETPSGDPQAEAALTAMPGMYGLALLDASLAGDHIQIKATTDCTTALEVLQSGQWAVESIAEPDFAARKEDGTDGAAVYLAALRLGNNMSVARLVEEFQEGDFTCVGRIASPATARFALVGMDGVEEGGAGDDALADYVPLVCRASQEKSSARVAGVYATDGGTYLVAATIAVTPGTAPLVIGGTDRLEVLRAPDGMPAIAWATRSLAEEIAKGDDPDAPAPGPTVLRDLLAAAADPGAAQRWTAGPGATASATVSETQPLTGSIAVQGLVPSSGAEPSVSMTAGFACQI